ncbi:exocyst complex component EXO84C [Nicotiana tabacum]|uniref:Exocyst complex component EXO84C n=1 Tax=Nicotiana tabacum TaxID=4097 RepID=A0A1S3Z824_TOBAC|nr:PREDICTED: exocyst complex component EXO84C-like [Nicotiana tabacum]
MRMESSEEEDDFPCIESVTPQSKIDSIYQSKTEKGIRKICFELLDLKDAVENLCGNTRTKCLAFLRLSEEVVETEHELNELRKHISAQGILVQDLMNGVCRELDEWSRASGDVQEANESLQSSDYGDTLMNAMEDENVLFLENIDVLLAEHKIEEAIEAIDAKERSHPELKSSGDTSSTEPSLFKSALSKRKKMLENQLVEITERPSIGIVELKKALSGLLKLGKGSLAHQLLIKSYRSRLQKSIEAFLPLCPCYPETYSATLSNLVFSTISLTTKESGTMFGDNPVYSNRIIQWAEREIEYFVRLVKEHAPPSDGAPALHAASVCAQASLNHCNALEKQGLKLSKLLLVLLRPYMEEVLELNFIRARKAVLDFASSDEGKPLSPRFASPLSTFATTSDTLLVESGMRFIYVVKEIVEKLTQLVILHFGANILTRISHLFDKYVDALIKGLPGLSEDDNLTELKEPVLFRAETDSEQLALLGTAFTIAEELLPMVVSRIWNVLNESKEVGSENMMPAANNTVELKDWRRQLQHSLDKLRDNFCQQYVVNFIYSRDGDARLDAQIYLSGVREDTIWHTDPLPSLPFQALFGKLQQLATVAGDVLLGREKIQKVLLARLTETVVIWLSDEQEFWSVLEDESAPLQPLGLQQLILDMHFTVEIARFAGYPSRQVHQIASDIIARAVRTFSARGIDPQSALPEDEWFTETAKGAINKLLLGGSGSDTSEIDDEHLIMHDGGMSDSDGSPSSLSSVDSSESFASAQMGDLDSPVYFSDPES